MLQNNGVKIAKRIYIIRENARILLRKLLQPPSRCSPEAWLKEDCSSEYPLRTIFRIGWGKC
jgi:hypothetical protein